MSGTTFQPLPEIKVPRKSDPYTAPLSRRTCKTLLGLVMAAALGIFVIQFVRGFVGEYHAVRVERDALKAASDAAVPGVASTGNRLVWGPPMTVVIRGEQWTVRTVMQEALAPRTASR